MCRLPGRRDDEWHERSRRGVRWNRFENPDRVLNAANRLRVSIIPSALIVAETLICRGG